MFYNVKIKNDTLGIDHGTFQGDSKKALAFIQTFCNSNDVRSEPYGHDYGSLFINDKAHAISPYGIDLNMMIKSLNSRI